VATATLFAGSVLPCTVEAARASASARSPAPSVGAMRASSASSASREPPRTRPVGGDEPEPILRRARADQLRVASRSRSNTARPPTTAVVEIELSRTMATGRGSVADAEAGEEGLRRGECEHEDQQHAQQHEQQVAQTQRAAVLRLRAQQVARRGKSTRVAMLRRIRWSSSGTPTAAPSVRKRGARKFMRGARARRTPAAAEWRTADR
jgi:hypothetical protein